MSGERNEELKHIREIMVELFQRLENIEVRDELGEDDPGPVPEAQFIPGQQSDPGAEPPTPFDHPDMPGAQETPSVFGKYAEDLQVVGCVLARIDAILLRELNIIRPSVGLEIIADVVDELIMSEVAEFHGNKPAWREAITALMGAADRLRNTQADTNLAWALDEINVDFDKALSFLTLQLRRFSGLYGDAMANTIGSSFGRLTPGEAVRILWVMCYKHVVNPPRWDVFSMPHPTVKGWYAPQPWAKHVREALRLMADEMMEVPTVEVPSEEVPYSVGGGRRW